jgi:hypothetical protein
LDQTRPTSGQTRGDPGCPFLEHFANEQKNNSYGGDAEEGRRKTELPGVVIEMGEDMQLGDQHRQKHLIDRKRIGVPDPIQRMIGGAVLPGFV